MKIKINKEENNTYSIIMESGHFNGKLTSITYQDLKELKDNIEDILNSNSHEYVWNPRSQRHELKI